MNKLYEALEVCLNDIEQGADVEAALSRYPDLADELHPMLETVAQAKGMAVPVPSADIVKRNRAKLLQHAAEMREGQITSSSRRVWSVPLRRVGVTFMVVAMLFVSSTNLVRAASTTLPGDNLYPVKRTWEDLSLLFTFDVEEREALELEHENERLDELHELFVEGRSANVDFAGYVTRVSGDEWRVSGITVFISSQTRLPDQDVLVGAAVRVRGQSQNGMSVGAKRVDLLPPGSKLPEVEDDELESDDDEEREGSNQSVGQNSGPGSVAEATVAPLFPTATLIFDPEDESMEGVVTSIEDNFVIVNGILMDIRYAEVVGVPHIGAAVDVEGNYDADGIFIVTKIKFKAGGSDNGDDSANSKDDGNINSNDDDDNDNKNDNDDHDNKNDNDNSNDSNDD